MDYSSDSSGSMDIFFQEIIRVRTQLQEVINAEEVPNAQHRNRRYIQRNRDEAHQRLMQDYFAEHAVFQGYYFRRRFRMHKPLFMRIVEDLTAVCDFFKQKNDARGTRGFRTLQKCTAALRMLAYATPPDALDENLRMSARVARESLHKICKHVMRLYGPKYLRKPTSSDIQKLYAHHANVHGFPGMLGSLDCLHWEWGNCPVAYHGQYTRGDHGCPTVILEAVASHDLWIWHAFFGAPGANNDINVLNMSPIFNNIYDGTAPDSSFVLHGSNYRYGYYLVDDIYPERSMFVKTLTCPNDQKRKKFKKAQEKARKDVERAFGALKKRWQILKHPATFTDTVKMSEVMYTCIILHNMILEDEGNAICEYDEDEIIPETQPFVDASPEYMERRNIVRNTEIHHDLRRDLTEHIWTVNHIDLNVEPEDDLEGQFSEDDFM